MNRHLSSGPLLVAALAVWCPGSLRAEQPSGPPTQAKLDLGLDLDEVMETAQEQIEAAREEMSRSVDQARTFAQKDIEEVRKRAAEQMEAARRQLEEARRQWRKQIEEARLQMQGAANSIRAIARHQRLNSAYARVGIVAGPPEAGSSSPGTVVQAVTPGGPADKAGIAAGDVITAVDGMDLQPARDGGEDGDAAPRVAKVLRRGRTGQPIEIEYRRGGEVRKAILQPQWRHAGSGDLPHASHRAVRAVHLPGGWLSLELAEINPSLGEYFGTSRGLLVVRAPSSPDVPVKAGDVILKVGEEEPSTPTQAVRLLRSYEPGQSIPVEILRQRKKQAVALRIPPAATDRQ